MEECKGVLDKGGIKFEEARFNYSFGCKQEGPVITKMCRYWAGQIIHVDA